MCNYARGLIGRLTVSESEESIMAVWDQRQKNLQWWSACWEAAESRSYSLSPRRWKPQSKRDPGCSISPRLKAWRLLQSCWCKFVLEGWRNWRLIYNGDSEVWSASKMGMLPFSFGFSSIQAISLLIGVTHIQWRSSSSSFLAYRSAIHRLTQGCTFLTS